MLSLTRKIQIIHTNPDPEIRKQHIHQLYEWRDAVRRMANIIITHKFIQQTVRDFVYIKDDIKEKFYVKDILKQGPGLSEQNITYKIISQLYPQVPSEIRSNLNQQIAGVFKSTLSDVLKGKASIRSYRNDIPIPFKGSNLIEHITIDEEGHYNFTLFKQQFQLRFGRDRSNNQAIVDRCIRGEYKPCVSNIQIDDAHKKTYLLLTYQMPEPTTVPDTSESATKTLFARIGISVPIIYMVDIQAKNDFDSGRKIFEIGTSEYFHRRQAIQEALRRLQQQTKEARGGHGRDRKLKAYYHLRKAESKYIKDKMHLYSKQLIDAAKEHHCTRIVLLDQERREQEAQENRFILRNWSYSGLKQFIDYKAQKEGIEVKVE